MKTPWSNLIQYGVGVATIAVMAICGIILLLTVGVAIAIVKVSVFIK